MLAALADGTTRLSNFSTGADCASTVACVSALGADVRKGQAGVLQITGRKLQTPVKALDCGNSGSTMRMLAGILAGQKFTSEMIGDESLSRRPMRRVIEPLERMGARIESEDGHAPLRIQGGGLHAIEYRLPVASAQVKSAVLLAGLHAPGRTSVIEPVPTRDHTELALESFGAKVDRDGVRVGIEGGQTLRAIEADIPGDLSSAAFFICAAALFPDSDVMISNLLLNPRRSVLLDVMKAMGANITVGDVERRHGELVGSLHVSGDELRGATIEGAETAALIDELPVLAAIAPFTRDGIEIGDARELRAKETDRISAVASNLRAMGAEVEEREDGLRVPGRQRLHGTDLDSFGDHRIAMAFAVAALRATGDTMIRGAGAARISYPEFFQVLSRIVQY